MIVSTVDNTNSCQPEELLTESISTTVTAANKTTFGALSNREGDKSKHFRSGQATCYAQTPESCHINENVTILETTLPTRISSTKLRAIERKLSLPAFERKSADKKLWGHIDPRIDWPELPREVPEEEIDSVLAARRAHNRQLGM